MARRTWTKDEDARLASMRAAGVTALVIAGALDRGAAAVAMRASALGLPRLKPGPGGFADPLAEFHARVDRSGGPDACWPWTGTLTQFGHGKMSFILPPFGPNATTHRVAFFLANGWLPPAPRLIRHSCDNAPCCNPAHLLDGTYLDNATDCIERGRHAGQAPRGEACALAKTTAHTVRAIRLAHRPGVFGHKRLAKAFGLSPATISAIVHRRTWAHVA